MMRLPRRRQALLLIRRRRPGAARGRRYLLAGVTAILLGFGIWPYLVLWRIDHAALQADPAVLAPYVDLEAVRRAITSKLNKDATSTIGPLSDRFIHWLQSAIASDGSGTIRRLVTLRWVRDQLLKHQSARDAGLLPGLSYAFFEAPDEFRVRIGQASENPTEVRMRLRHFRWRITAVYY
ncbi:MAG: DUF2939 domain-containing protein [Chromatiaceae bacterium]